MNKPPPTDHGNLTQPDGDNQRAQQLLTEIAAQRAEMNPAPKAKPALNYYSLGIKLAMEAVAPLAVGLFLGFWLDEWLDTRPFLMIFMAFLGIGAGIKAIYTNTMRK